MNQNFFNHEYLIINYQLHRVILIIILGSHNFAKVFHFAKVVILIVVVVLEHFRIMFKNYIFV